MAKYIRTKGKQTLSVGICDRCSFKFAYDDLFADPDRPGLRVCQKCMDGRDPYKLPARQTEKIALRYPRPEVDIATTDAQAAEQVGDAPGQVILPDDPEPPQAPEPEPLPPIVLPDVTPLPPVVLPPPPPPPPVYVPPPTSGGGSLPTPGTTTPPTTSPPTGNYSPKVAYWGDETIYGLDGTPIGTPTPTPTPPTPTPESTTDWITGHFHIGQHSHRLYNGGGSTEPTYDYGIFRDWDCEGLHCASVWNSDDSIDEALIEQVYQGHANNGAKVLKCFGSVPSHAARRPTEVNNSYPSFPGGKSGPADYVRYKAYCKKFITRFRQYLYAVEGWNEPWGNDSSHKEFSTMSPTEQADTQKALYEAAKEVDPNLPVFGPCQAYVGGIDDILNCVTSQGEPITDFFDVLSWHAYNRSASGFEGISLATEAAQVRSIMAAKGINKPIADTEHGWLGGSKEGGAEWRSFSATQQGQILYDTAAKAKELGLVCIVYYSHETDLLGTPMNNPTVSSYLQTSYTNLDTKWDGSATPATPTPPTSTGNIESVRYVRNTINGNNINAGNHWVEVQALQGSTNRAAGRLPTTGPTAWTPDYGALSLATDGSLSSGYINGPTGTAYIQIDLGALYAIDTVKIWHYWDDARTYRYNKVEVSQDGLTWLTIFDSEVNGRYIETSSGRSFTVPLGTPTSTPSPTPTTPSGTTRVGVPAPQAFASGISSLNFSVTNEGIVGQTNAKTIAGTDGYHPALNLWASANNHGYFIINNCINEFKAGVSLANYGSGLSSIIDTVRADGMFAICETPNPTEDAGLLDYVNRMKEIAGVKGVPVIDQYTYLNQYMILNAMDLTDLMPDGQLPNQACYTLKGQYAAQRFIEILNLNTVPTTPEVSEPVPTIPSTLVATYAGDICFKEDFLGESVRSTYWTPTMPYESEDGLAPYVADFSTVNYAVENEKLKLWPIKNAEGNFFRKTLSTSGKFHLRNGIWEVKVKMPRGKGVWPIIWLANYDGISSTDDIRELIIAEAYPGGGYDSGWSDSNYRPDNYAVGAYLTASGNFTTVYRKKLSELFVKEYLDDDSATYTIIVKQNTFQFFFNGKAMGSFQTGPSAIDARYFLTIGLWYGGESGLPDNTTPVGKTNSLEIEHVYAWKLKEGSSLISGTAPLYIPNTTTPTPPTTTPPTTTPTTPTGSGIWPYGRNYSDFLDIQEDENFSAALSTSKWSAPTNYDVNSGSNGLLRIWPQSPFVTDDMDSLWTKQYGYWEFDVKLPIGHGLRPMWSLESDSYVIGFQAYPGIVTGGWANGSYHPIDFATSVYRIADDTMLYSERQSSHTGAVDLSAASHKYAIEYTNTHLRFFFDGEEVGKYTHNGSVSGLLHVELAIRYYNSETTAGAGTPEGSTNAMEVNYVRYWPMAVAASTPGTGVGPAPTTPTADPTPPEDYVIWEDFDGEQGSFSEGVNARPNTSLNSTNGTEGGYAMRVAYVPYESGSQRVIYNHVIPAGQIYSMSFDVKFHSLFDFAKGGKLHGFQPVNGISGGNTMEPDGWSARGMWRPDGRLQSYIYHQDLDGTFGDVNQNNTFYLQKQRYYAFTYVCKVNDFGLSNGYFQIWVDGVLIIDHQNIRFRAVDTDDSLINRCCFNTFHGGSDTTWSPRDADGNPVTVYAYFDNWICTPGVWIKTKPTVTIEAEEPTPTPTPPTPTPPTVTLPNHTVEVHGTSFIYGYDGAAGGGRVANPSPSYVAAAYPNIIVRNEGVNSSTSSELLDGTNGVHQAWSIHCANSNAQVMVISHGFFEAYDMNIASWKTNLTNLFNAANAVGKKVIFMSIHKVNPVMGDQFDEFAYAMRDHAAVLGAGYIDMWDYTSEMFTGSIEDWVPDNYHPNQAAYTIIGEWFASRYAEEYNKLYGTATPTPPTTTPPTNPTYSGSMPFGRDASRYTALTFEDEFNGTELNRSIWNDAIWYQTSHPIINYAVRDGMLKIWPVDPFVNRTIDTDGKFYQRGGYFEAEMRLNRGRGVWPAFWIFGHPGDLRPEIDIMEAYPGGGPSGGWGTTDLRPVNYGATVHHTLGDTAGSTTMQNWLPAIDLSADFHKYAVEWDSQGATFFFDGQQLGPKILSTRVWHDLYIMFDLWFGSASGQPNTAETPQGESNSFEIRYVRAWQFK